MDTLDGKHKNAKCRTVFGKKSKDLTSTERYRLYGSYVPTGAFANGYCQTTYGKPVRKLSVEERREYNRLKKQESRERQKKGD